MKPSGFGYEGDPHAAEVSKKGKIAPPTYEGMKHEDGHHGDRICASTKEGHADDRVQEQKGMHGCTHPMQQSHPLLSDVQPNAGMLEGSSQPKGASPKAQQPWRHRRCHHR